MDADLLCPNQPIVYQMWSRNNSQNGMYFGEEPPNEALTLMYKQCVAVVGKYVMSSGFDSPSIYIPFIESQELMSVNRYFRCVPSLYDCF